MKKLPLLLCTLPITFLGGCTQVTSNQTLSDYLKNPLYADYYYKDSIDVLSDIEIRPTLSSNAPLVKDSEMLQKIYTEKVRMLAAQKDLEKTLETLSRGPIQSDDFTVQGSLALQNDTLYTSPLFYVPASAHIEVYVSSRVDPRDKDFPTKDVVRITNLASSYGEQVLHIIPPSIPVKSIVLYDAFLKRIIGFAQLSKG